MTGEKLRSFAGRRAAERISRCLTEDRSEPPPTYTVYNDSNPDDPSDDCWMAEIEEPDPVTRPEAVSACWDHRDAIFREAEHTITELLSEAGILGPLSEIQHAEGELRSLPETRLTERLGWEGILANARSKLRSAVEPAVSLICTECDHPSPHALGETCQNCKRGTLVTMAELRDQARRWRWPTHNAEGRSQAVQVARPAALVGAPPPIPKLPKGSSRAHGASWRFQAQSSRDTTVYKAGDNSGKFTFDRLVVDNWFHLAQVDSNTWWAHIGDACVSICLKSGTPVVRVERGVYGPEASP